MNLQLNEIKKAYGGKEVLKGCSFTFEKGKIYGLLGRNGAGKTTLFNCLTDELPARLRHSRAYTGRTARGARLLPERGGVCVLHPHSAGLSHRL